MSWKPFLGNLAAFLACCILFAGCNSVSTYNYKVSQTIIRSAVQENSSPKELSEKALIIICTSEKEKQSVKLCNQKEKASASVDKESFAAFLVPEGQYSINTCTISKIEKNKCYVFVVSPSKVYSISINDFQKNHSKKFLSKECTADGDISTAEKYFTNKVSRLEVFGHNTGVVFVAIGYVVLYAILVAGIILLVLIELRTSAGPSNTQNNITIYTYKKDAYGLGVHADSYGRPFKWEVKNHPNANSSFLEVTPTGPSTGIDQYGRTVKAVLK